MSGGPLDFGVYITPEQARNEYGDNRTLQELRELAKVNGKCANCDNPIWRYAGGDMCFPCTTGESDASDDCELVKP